MNNLLKSFEKTFPNMLKSTKFNYEVNDNDLIKIHHILNENVFDLKLNDSLKFIIKNFNKNLNSKALYVAGKKDKQFIEYIVIVAGDSFHSKDNFFKLVSALCHEMIHEYDFKFGEWSLQSNKYSLKTDLIKKIQYVNEYHSHGKYFQTWLNKINNLGLAVTQYFNSNDGIFMNTKNVNEDIDEMPIDDRNILSDDYSKKNI